MDILNSIFLEKKVYIIIFTCVWKPYQKLNIYASNCRRPVQCYTRCSSDRRKGFRNVPEEPETVVG